MSDTLGESSQRGKGSLPKSGTDANLEEKAVLPGAMRGRPVSQHRPVLAQVSVTVAVLASTTYGLRLIATDQLLWGSLAIVAAILAIPLATAVSRCRCCGSRLGWSLLLRQHCPSCGAELRRGTT